VFIAETLLVLEQGAEVLTRGVSRIYQDISYYLDDDDGDSPTNDTANLATN